MVRKQQAIAAHRSHESHVSFERTQVPQGWPTGRYDLIVLSEVLYYLSPRERQRWLMPGGGILLVNYTKKIDEPCGGEEAWRYFMQYTASENIRADQLLGMSFRIDMLMK